MSYSVQRNAGTVIATVQTTSAAELIRATLGAHGIEVTVAPRAYGHPSVDFVEGLDVSVPPEVEAQARALLTDV